MATSPSLLIGWFPHRNARMPAPGAASSGPDPLGSLVDLLQQELAHEQDPFDMTVTTLRLPWSYEGARLAVTTALRETRPALLLLLDQPPNETDHVLHHLAANFVDDPEPDDDGHTLSDHIIDPDGPVAYRTKLPLDGIWDKFLVERVPARMGHKAGLGVYNHTLYQALRTIDLDKLPTLAGAIQLPSMAQTDHQAPQTQPPGAQPPQPKPPDGQPRQGTQETAPEPAADATAHDVTRVLQTEGLLGIEQRPRTADELVDELRMILAVLDRFYTPAR